MQGVEILTSAQIVTETVFNWDTFWNVISILSILGLYLSVVITFENDLKWYAIPVILFVFIVAFSIIGGVAGDVNRKPSAYETQYKVTISDEVSMTEFIEHYEVIEQDGKIFTIREKNNNE